MQFHSSRGVGNRESGVGSRESGSRESGVGSRESGIGLRNLNIPDQYKKQAYLILNSKFLILNS
ncbi:hypothetical protein [Moorena sp. SIO3I6]|uniref:hypothetical protein n=1 Tax=Moorena sp. SIO3I6 TaxID=2607831 RepID=UPI0013FA13A6|nr:hypothetical protein [Moorena sp. SIO3I6]NEP26995.1 hypothetical protein [Moorena sp. SIO3I6]